MIKCTRNNIFILKTDQYETDAFFKQDVHVACGKAALIEHFQNFSNRSHTHQRSRLNALNVQYLWWHIFGKRNDIP